MDIGENLRGGIQVNVRKTDSEALISIRPEFVEAIVSGEKTVEFRRRNLKLEPNSRLWIYCTSPTAAVTALAIVTKVHSGHVSEIWRTYGSKGYVSRLEFDEYFDGVEKAFAIEIAQVSNLLKPIELADLRSVVDGFQPPQTYVRVPPGHPFQPLFERAVI